MKLIAIFSESRNALQRAIDQEAVNSQAMFNRPEISEASSGNNAIYGAPAAVMAVIGRLANSGHKGLLHVAQSTMH